MVIHRWRIRGRSVNLLLRVSLSRAVADACRDLLFLKRQGAAPLQPAFETNGAVTVNPDSPNKLASGYRFHSIVNRGHASSIIRDLLEPQ